MFDLIGFAVAWLLLWFCVARFVALDWLVLFECLLCYWLLWRGLFRFGLLLVLLVGCFVCG